MRTSWLIIVAAVSVSGPAAAEQEVKRVTAPEELVKAPKTVGRRFLTGLITRDSTVETFTLQRLGERALLTVETVRAENDDAKIGPWTKHSLIQYLGTAKAEGDTLRIKVANRPLDLDWTCTKTKVDVAAATAVRARDPKWKGKECGDPGRWQPAATKKLEVLQCRPFAETTDDADAPAPEHASMDNLAFAAPPGVEWLHVNDDCMMQGGGWRKVPENGSNAAVRAKGARSKK